MYVYFKELSLEEGFEISELPRDSRIVAGREVSTASGWPLFRALRGAAIACWQCGCVADRWVSGRGQKEHSRPVLNLYALRTVNKKDPRPELVMMTRDHIIPKSMGGIDAVENLRPGCAICNERRGSKLNKAEFEFMEANPHLVNASRLAKGLERQQREDVRQAELDARMAEARLLVKPFRPMT